MMALPFDKERFYQLIREMKMSGLPLSLAKLYPIVDEGGRKLRDQQKAFNRAVKQVLLGTDILAQHSFEAVREVPLSKLAIYRGEHADLA